MKFASVNHARIRP